MGSTAIAPRREIPAAQSTPYKEALAALSVRAFHPFFLQLPPGFTRSNAPENEARRPPRRPRRHRS